MERSCSIKPVFLFPLFYTDKLQDFISGIFRRFSKNNFIKKSSIFTAIQDIIATIVVRTDSISTATNSIIIFYKSSAPVSMLLLQINQKPEFRQQQKPCFLQYIMGHILLLYLLQS